MALLQGLIQGLRAACKNVETQKNDVAICRRPCPTAQLSGAMSMIFVLDVSTKVDHYILLGR